MPFADLRAGEFLALVATLKRVAPPALGSRRSALVEGRLLQPE